MNKPNVFIGSSREGKPLAEAMLAELEKSCFPHCWWNYFENASGRTNLDEILELRRVDFAVIILGAADHAVVRVVTRTHPATI
jgi:predicted nucleotide-binding protein